MFRVLFGRLCLVSMKSRNFSFYVCLFVCLSLSLSTVSACVCRCVCVCSVCVCAPTGKVDCNIIYCFPVGAAAIFCLLTVGTAINVRSPVAHGNVDFSYISPKGWSDSVDTA